MGIVGNLFLSPPALYVIILELSQQVPLFSGFWLGLASRKQHQDLSKQVGRKFELFDFLDSLLSRLPLASVGNGS